MFSRSVGRTLLQAASARPLLSACSVPAMSRLFATAPAMSTSKRLSLALKKEFETEAEVLTSDYYESENNLLKTYLKNHPEWKITEKPMCTSVELTKKYGSEDITILFDKEMEDYPTSESNSNEEEKKEEEEQFPLMLPFTAIISKGDKGALSFDCLYRQTGFTIDSVRFFPNTRVAIENNATADYERRTLYGGPEISSYDEALQEKFFQYLEERGVDEEFAQFCDTFAVLKERRDYSDFLRATGKFLEL